VVSPPHGEPRPQACEGDDLRDGRALLAAVAGLGFAAATLGAYLITRTVGLLGFDDNQLNWEAVVA
jgi:hypothetical protein